MTLCKKLTIFEGCDGSGKTTAAKAYAAATNARYVHFGPANNIGFELPRYYLEAMIPALLGYQDVVFDRSWISEEPYGRVFRDGQNRIGKANQLILENIAKRCGAVIVYCDPGINQCLKAWGGPDREEMIKEASTLKKIHATYLDFGTTLPVFNFDWQGADLEINRPLCHPLNSNSIGNPKADYILVIEEYGGFPKPGTLSFEFPYCVFQDYEIGDPYQDNVHSSSRMVKHFRHLFKDNLLIVATAADIMDFNFDLSLKTVIACGPGAEIGCLTLELKHILAQHPTCHESFEDAKSDKNSLYNVVLGLGLIK
jgi:hypothetical protein